MISVSGTERVPACFSWLVNASSSALPELIDPASPTKTSGWRSATAAVVCVIASMRFFAES